MATTKKKTTPSRKKKSVSRKTVAPAKERNEFTATGLRKRKKRASRLSIADWVNEAIEILVTRSVEHVRVEQIAVNLGATKGSFYWHFKNREALLDAVIDAWKQRATTSVEAWVQSGNAGAKEQLQRLLDFRPTDTRWNDLELAMRAWSRRSQRVRMAAQEVDRHRLKYLNNLFGELGFEGEDARARVIIFYGAIRTMGQATKMAPLTNSFRERVLNMILMK